MDLTTYISTAAQLEIAKRVLDYQPFILNEDTQTGAAFGWMYGTEEQIKEQPKLLFQRSERDWGRITEANGRLRAMYEDFADEISHWFPKCSFLDVACNNGYMPAAMARRGAKATGIDIGGHYQFSVAFLNEVLGINADFRHAGYNTSSGRIELDRKFDVVSAMAIMCHLPDPLRFLAALGELATSAVFFMGQVVDTDSMIVSYNRPHTSLGEQGSARFPYRFNDNTRLSRGLLFHGFHEMGFINVVELQWRPSWLPPYFRADYTPELVDDPRIAPMVELMTGASRHVALLAMR